MAEDGDFDPEGMDVDEDEVDVDVEDLEEEDLEEDDDELTAGDGSAATGLDDSGAGQEDEASVAAAPGKTPVKRRLKVGGWAGWFSACQGVCSANMHAADRHRFAIQLELTKQHTPKTHTHTHSARRR